MISEKEYLGIESVSVQQGISWIGKLTVNMKIVSKNQLY